MFSETRVVRCECERIFDVVADVVRYPEFVPGWLEVRVLHEEASELLVEQRLGLGAFSSWVRSRATLRRPESILVRPLDDRAAGLHLEWRFARDAAGSCNVWLEIHGQSSNHLLAAALDAAGEHTGRRLIEIFAARSAALHGAPCHPDHRT